MTIAAGFVMHGAAVVLLHERPAFELLRFLIASLGAQGIGQQPPGLALRAVIAAREHQRLAAAAFGLVGIALREPEASALDPQQGIGRLDAQGAVERR